MPAIMSLPPSDWTLPAEKEATGSRPKTGPASRLEDLRHGFEAIQKLLKWLKDGKSNVAFV